MKNNKEKSHMQKKLFTLFALLILGYFAGVIEPHGM